VLLSKHRLSSRGAGPEAFRAPPRETSDFNPSEERLQNLTARSCARKFGCRFVVLSGADGDDAKNYEEKNVATAIQNAQKAK
jgi:hypothetical protein